MVRPSAAVRNASLLLAFTLRRRYGWCIDANGAGDEVAEQVADRKVLLALRSSLHGFAARHSGWFWAPVGSGACKRLVVGYS